MGVFYDDLPGHEGYAAGRLADGTSTTTTGPGVDLVGWMGACSCGWLDEHTHGADEDGREAALDRWDHVHAVPLLGRAVPRHVEELVEQVRRAVAALADDRPHAAADVLENRRMEPGAASRRSQSRRPGLEHPATARRLRGPSLSRPADARSMTPAATR